MANTPIQDIISSADSMSALATNLACYLDVNSKDFSPQLAGETLEKILESSQKLCAPENFAHIRDFLAESETDTLEMHKTKLLTLEDFGL